MLFICLHVMCELYRLYITLPNKQGLRQVIAHLMQDEGHHHAAASAQVRAFGRLLKNEARGPGKAAKVEDGPEKLGKIHGKIWQNMAKYGQNLAKIDPWSILVHEKLENNFWLVFSIYIYYLLPRRTHQFYRLESPVFPEFP